MIRVSVVIPNLNGMDFLQDALTSLEGQSERNMEVILIDNGSCDGSAAFVKEQFPAVKVIVLDKNYGFCKAVNMGIKKAKAPYVILLNNDTRVERDFVKELADAMDRNPKCFSGASQMLQMYDPELMDDGGNYYCALGWAFARGKGKNKEAYNTEKKIFAACAGGAIYRKEVFTKIGYFDEAHFAYLEDVDIGYRARIAGYENRYFPRAVVLHAGSATSGSRYNSFKIKNSARNSIYIIYKNMPFLQILLNIPFLLLGFFIKTMFFAKKGFFKDYAGGLLTGLSSLKRVKKVKTASCDWKNYLQIQLELWINILRMPGNS